jgi:hypothetical protein
MADRIELDAKPGTHADRKAMLHDGFPLFSKIQKKYCKHEAREDRCRHQDVYANITALDYAITRQGRGPNQDNAGNGIAILAGGRTPL